MNNNKAEWENLERQRLELEKQRLDLEQSQLLNQLNSTKQTQQQILLSQERNLKAAPKKLNKLLLWSILEIVFLVIAIVFLVVAIVSVINHNIEDVLALFIACISISSLAIIIGIVFEILTVVYIFGVDYGNAQINEMRMLWGLLTIFIGIFTSIAFVVIAKRILKQNKLVE